MYIAVKPPSQLIVQAHGAGFGVHDHERTAALIAELAYESGELRYCHGAVQAPADVAVDPLEFGEYVAVVRYNVAVFGQHQRVLEFAQRGLGGRAEDNYTAEQPGECVDRQIEEVCMLERQRLHLVEQQHGTRKRGHAPDVAPGCGKCRIQKLDHRAANHGTALPAAGIHLVVCLIPGLGYEVGVVLEHVFIPYSLPYPAGVLAGDGFEGGKVEYVPGVYAPCGIQAEAQPGVGLSRSGRQA